MQLDNKSTSDPTHKLFLKSKEGSRKMFFPAWIGLNDKTLWDVLSLLCTAAIPLTIGLMTLKQADSARQQEEQSQIRNDDNQKAKIMSDYLDAMTKYLLEDSAKAPISSKATMIARARTLNTLRQLDANRKGQLLKFLYEANLVTPCKPDAVTGKATNCKVSKLGLNEARLDAVTFDIPIPMPGIELTGASLPKAELPGIDLTRAQLQKANLEGANLEGATLTQAQLNSVILRDAKVTDADLGKAVLTKSLLSNVDLRGSRLIGSSLKRADLSNANLSNSDLTSANLQNAIFKNATLDNSNLTKADLRDADFTGATLTRTTILRGALYNKRTKFPENFKPDGIGMIRQD